MATREVTVDQPVVDQAPVDPNVIIPKHVLEASARADAAYNAAYAPPEAGTEAPLQPTDVGVAPPVETAPANPPAPTHEVSQPPPAPAPQNVDWEQRYNSMKGRWQASERMRGEMRTQMDTMATELQRTQAMMQHPQHPEPPQENLITQDEVNTYGEDLLNVARKIAVQTLSPEIQAIQAQNAELKQRLIQQGQRDQRAQLTAAVPNWQQIIQTPAWQDWLRLPNVYTGEVRGKVLEAARQAADAPRVIAIFKEYIRDTIATGGQLPGMQVQEQPQQAPRREPAMSLESIAAPGRAKPATGDLPAPPVDKPIYTRQQVAKFYSDSRRGAFAGREAEKNRIEADIFAAQREGRVR